MPRARLNLLLDRVAETGILLVSAGAGYGKTAALSSWVSGLDDDMIVWINCREEHNDPHRLTTDLASGLQEIASDAKISRLGDVADAVETSNNTAVVVLDDVQRLTNPSVWEAVEHLLALRPDNLRVVISGRGKTGLSLHDLRARGEIIEIHDADLRFTRAEAAALLAETYGIEDPDKVLGPLLAATQGWVTGLCLAGHALRHGAGNGIARPALGGQPYLRPYFDDELITGLKSDDVRFLELTCLLERLDPELCDLLTGRSDSHAVLEYLVENHYFTEQISTVPPVFQYHQLFAQYLQNRSSRAGTTAGIEELSLASIWYEEHGLSNLAIEYSFRSGDIGRAESLIRAASGPTLRSGFPHTVARWLSGLGQESFDANPDLALLLARSAGATGDLLTANAGVVAVGAHIEASTAPVPTSLRLAHQILAFVTALWAGDLVAAQTELDRAEALAAEDGNDPGPDAYGLYTTDLGAYRATLHLLNGDLDDAIGQVERILTPGQLVHPAKEAVLAVGVRALAMAWRDDSPSARQAVEQCRAAASAFGGRTGGLLALLLAGAWCADLDVAESDLERAHSIVLEAPLPIYCALYKLAEARAELRAARWEAAQAGLDQARRILATMPSCPFLDSIESGLRLQVLAAASHDVEMSLTERECEVLREIADGASRQEAAARLYLSINTVKTYLRSAYHKLGASSRDEAIERAKALGLLDPPSP